MKRIAFILLAAIIGVTIVNARSIKGVRVYINPGHGGYDSDDRPLQIYPFASGDTAGYWESTSNLYKGLHLKYILDSIGAQTRMSRVKNTTSDDRSLSGIANEANEWNADVFFSIHSNAGEDCNTPLTIYRENSRGVPRFESNVTLSNYLWDNLHSSHLSIWTRESRYVIGDLTFYYGVYTNGLGVLRPLWVTGLLSEGSNHEHRPEAHRLMNDDFRWLEAWHFAKTVLEFVNADERFVTGNIAGVVYDNHNLRTWYYPFLKTYHTFERDRLAALNGAYIELINSNGEVIQKRTTDNMYNGVYVFRNVTPGTYTVRTTLDGYYSDTKQVTVVANQVTYQDVSLVMKREMPLEIVSYSPNITAEESVSCSTRVEFEFNTDVDEQSFEEAFSITPVVDGYFEYDNSYRKVAFVPNLSLEKDMTYTVRVANTARTADPNYADNKLREPLEFSFTTKGRDRLTLIDSYPAQGGEVHYKTPTFEFRFDNEIDATNMYDVVKIYDENNNELAPNRRSCSFNKLSNKYGNIIYVMTSDFEPGKTYRAEISTELRDKENLPLDHKFEVSFVAKDVAGDKEGSVVESFEDADLFAYSPDESVGITTPTPKYVRSTTRLFGSASGRYSYSFGENHGGAVVWNYNGEPKQFVKGDKIGLHINGDFNNHELYLGVTSGTDTKFVKVADLNFRGWEYVEATLDNLEAEDMEGNPLVYLLSKIKLVQVASPITQTGIFSLDNLLYLGNAGVETVAVDDANAGRPVEYYNLQGVRMNGVPSSTGIYIRRQGTSAMKIVIK